MSSPRLSQAFGRPVASTALVCLLLVAGCTGAQRAARVASVFPSREELASVLQRPAPSADVEGGVRRVDADEWALQGPLPDTVGETPAPSSSPWERLLRDAIRERGEEVEVTVEMNCVARELGRFLLERGAAPPRDAQSFIEGRCGAVAHHVSFWFATGGATASTTDEQLLRDAVERPRESIRDALGDGHQVAGVALVRSPSRYALVVTRDVRAVELEPLSQLPDASGTVTLFGRVYDRPGDLDAIVTHGAHASVACERDPTMPLPLFRFTCATERGDDIARIALVGRHTGRRLGEPIFTVLVRPDGGSHTTWRRPDHPHGPIGDTPEESAARMLALINHHRADAGLAPVALAREESRTACRVAPWYFAARAGRGDARAADTVALGLLAGWDVEGVVGGGEIGSMRDMPTRDLGAWVVAALQAPHGRRALLSAETSQVALCAWTERDGSLRGALWAAYATLDASHADEEARAAHARIMRERRARGATTAPPDPTLTEVARDFARRIERGDFGTLDDALHVMLQAAASQDAPVVAGSIASPERIETMEVSGQMAQGPGAIGVAVAYWRDPEALWTRRHVLVIGRR